MRRSAWLAALPLLVVACSSGDDATSDTAATADSAVADTTEGSEPVDSGGSVGSGDDVAPTTTAPPESTTTATDSDDAGSVPTETTAPATTAPPTTVPLLDGVTPSIDLLTPAIGGGIRPLLEWASVDGASYYTVTVYAPDGQPYWMWTGESTAVPLGGEPVLADERPGPSLSDGMTWGVVAFDETVVPIAASARDAIAP